MLFFITVAVLLASANAKFYTDCGSKLATVEMVGVSGCADDAKECILKKNTNATISIDFIPSMDVTSIKAVVSGIIVGVPTLFYLPQTDACQDSGITCPLKAGDKASYRATLPVSGFYPKVRVNVIWELRNQDYEDVVCTLISARIK